ncbi:MAG: DNA replication/repair protein RecF [Bacteroidota bacterium]
MHLKKLSVVNFKNYDEAEIDLSPNINCFTGANGVGKTNLLDAVYYLSLCKSFFNPIDSQNISHGKDFFVIEGHFEREGEKENIYCGVKRGRKKVFKRNKNDYDRLSDHVGLLPVVMISPADSVLIEGGSEERRKFVNGVISQYDKLYLENVIRYNNALAQRNKLLKEIDNREGFDEQLLEVWNEQLVPLGESIFNYRDDFVKKLIPFFQEYYQIISGNDEVVSLGYQSHLQENNFGSLLKSSLRKDMILQYTTRGIHKDDLSMFLEEHPIKKTGSQGQRKTYLVALKLAKFTFIQHVTRLNPVLLLDDIFDKFDESRVKQIIRLVAEERFGQIFITDTHTDRMKVVLEELNSDYKLFVIEKNQVRTV